MTITFHDLDIMSRTIYGEARGEPQQGKLAVAHVIRNRWKAGKWFSKATIADTCQQPFQFSCWNEGDPMRLKIEAVGYDKGSFRACVDAALAVLLGDGEDPTGGSTHYYADYIAVPKWAIGHQPVATIGRHRFYKGID